MQPQNEQTCPKCGIPQSEWSGNSGQGYDVGGQTYCCEGCFTDTGCTCKAES